MKKSLEDKLKKEFANDFSLLYKNWEQKPYYVFAEAAAKKKQFAQLPVDMLLYSLNISHKIELEPNVFDFLICDGCKEYDNYVFEKLPDILEKVRSIELHERHMYSLCKLVNKQFWEKSRISEGISFANTLLDRKRNCARENLEYDLKWALRKTCRDDCKLSSDEIGRNTHITHIHLVSTPFN